MFQKWILGCASVALLSATGCENAMDHQQKADEAREEARVSMDKAHAEADVDVRKARAEAARKVAESEADFSKLRGSYRHEVQANLIELDAKIAKLRERAQTEKAKTKADTDAVLATIEAKREQIQLSLGDLDRTTAETWDASRAAVDKLWEDLKKLVPRTS